MKNGHPPRTTPRNTIAHFPFTSLRLRRLLNSNAAKKKLRFSEEQCFLPNDIVELDTSIKETNSTSLSLISSGNHTAIIDFVETAYTSFDYKNPFLCQTKIRKTCQHSPCKLSRHFSESKEFQNRIHKIMLAKQSLYANLTKWTIFKKANCYKMSANFKMKINKFTRQMRDLIENIIPTFLKKFEAKKNTSEFSYYEIEWQKIITIIGQLQRDCKSLTDEKDWYYKYCHEPIIMTRSAMKAALQLP